MSDKITHECGIAMIRLLKPLDYYLEKYGTAFWGLKKLYLLMEKQHNRGQDGAGFASLKFGLRPGHEYINRVRSNASSPIKACFTPIFDEISKETATHPENMYDIDWLKHNMDFAGEIFIGHLRYGTFGKNKIEYLHPFHIHHHWKTKSLVVAGNFNMTNTDEIFNQLIELGQHPVQTADTITIMEMISNYLDEESDRIYNQLVAETNLSKNEILHEIEQRLDLGTVLKKAAQKWDGGYVMGGFVGNGDVFVLRDPCGIRPAFFYQDDEVVVAASERPAIQTVFNVPAEAIHEITPGNALIVRQNNEIKMVECLPQREIKQCSFERIYFSRGTDKDIYQERRKLGELLTPRILKSVNYDFDNTVFSYIPNTAISAFYGMFDGLRKHCNEVKKEKILQLGSNPKAEDVECILAMMPRLDNIAVKDAKLRTFISQDSQRDDLVTHVYDITYGTINKDVDTLVVIDDSIVRGTTLRQSILRILDRLRPKKIIIASSAPQIRYPDCYGIDMAKMSDFIAFQAAIALLKETKQTHVINHVYKKCKSQEGLPKEEMVNYVREIYEPFTAEEISTKISELLRPKDLNAEVQIIFNSITDLHTACPNNNGDWYFTGRYPTPGGNKVVNRSFINYVEQRNERAY